MESVAESSPRRFEIYECGDPYSRAWDTTEVAEFSDRFGVYRGDLSGIHSRGGLISHLRRLYPGCEIVNRDTGRKVAKF